MSNHPWKGLTYGKRTQAEMALEASEQAAELRRQNVLLTDQNELLRKAVASLISEENWKRNDGLLTWDGARTPVEIVRRAAKNVRGEM